MNTMQDHYAINIARGEMVGWDGKMSFQHFAKVTLTHVSPTEARAKLSEFVARFPTADGWMVSMTRWEGRGYDVT